MNPFSIYSHDSHTQQERHKKMKRCRHAHHSEISSQYRGQDEFGEPENMGAGLINNNTLESLVMKPSRATFDQLPYDDIDGADEEEGGRCIGCMYVSAAASTGTEEDRDALQQLHDIIMSNHNCKCSDRELVNLVYDFYEKEIRSWQDFGHWSKKMIHAHIYIHLADPDIQTAGLAQLLYTQIESLRNCCWQKNTETGEMTPIAVNIKLLNDLIAKHQTLLEARRKRAK